MHPAATPLTHTKETIRTHKALGAQDQQMKALSTFKRAKHANEAHFPTPPYTHSHVPSSEKCQQRKSRYPTSTCEKSGGFL